MTDEDCFEINFEKIGKIMFKKNHSIVFDRNFKDFFLESVIGIGLLIGFFLKVTMDYTLDLD